MKLDYCRQIKPLAEGIERTLFDELVAAAWKLRRAQRLETELLSQSGDLLEQLDDDKLQKKLDNMARHKTRIERTFYRAMKELKALQTNRLEHNLLFQIREPLPGLADFKRFAKQTQAAVSADPDSLRRRRNQQPHILLCGAARYKLILPAKRKPQYCRPMAPHSSRRRRRSRRIRGR